MASLLQDGDKLSQGGGVYRGSKRARVYSHGRQLSAFNQADAERRKVGGIGTHLAFAEASRTNRIKGVCDVISQGDVVQM